MTRLWGLNGIGLLLMWAAVVPFYTQPMRFEPYEPGRAGLIVVLAVGTLAVVIAGGWRKLRREVLVLAIWAAVLVIVTVFALSPVTALMGDLIRRFGSLTQIALLCGALIGALVTAHYGGAALARLFWIAGIVISAFTLLQQAYLYPTISPTYYPLRSSSVIGYPTYLGGWIYLCVLICAVYAPFRSHWIKQIIWWAGIVLIAAALIPSGSRTATLALGAGLFTAILLVAALRRWRWIILLIGVGALAGLILLPRVIGLRGIPLFQRLDLSVQGNETQDLRLSIWGEAISAVQTFPVLIDVNGVPDRFSALRPLIGYGWDMQETIYDHAPSISSEIIDRAHNFWLDTLLTGGWIAFVVRAGLIVGIGLWALRRLNLLKLLVILPAWIAIVGAVFLTRGSVWLPVVATLAGVGGLWLGLLLYLLLPRRTDPVQWDRPALLAITAVIAFLIDVQLGFETVIVGFTFWLVVGGLFARADADAPAEAPPNRLMLGAVALGGAALLRQIAFNAPSPRSAQIDALVSGAILLVGLGYLLWLDRRRLRLLNLPLALLALAAIWAYGWFGIKAAQPYAAALWDILWLVGGSLLFGLTGTESDSASSATAPGFGQRVALGAAAVITVIVLGWWWIDIAGDIALRQGNILIAKAPTWEESALGASLRFWDERAWLYSAAQALNAAKTATSDDQRVTALEQASDALSRAARLQAFDADLASLDRALQQAESGGS